MADSSNSSNSSSSSAKSSYPYNIIVYGQKDELPKDCILVNATSRSKEQWSVGLSPFYLGPVDLYDRKVALNVENAWQYAKVYPEHAVTPPTDMTLHPSKLPKPGPKYFSWAEGGWKDSKPQRFPMGRGAIPMYSYWNGEQLGYVEARKKIYCPLYAALVEKTEAYKRLKSLYEKAVREKKVLAIFDFDGHNSLDHFNGSYEKVFYNHKMKMGHGFVLAMMLENQRIWEKDFEPEKIHFTKVPARVSPENQVPSETTLFVTGFPLTTTQEKIATWFTSYGGKTNLAKNKTGNSKGFAFIEFNSHEAQLRALAGAKPDIEGVTIKPAFKKQDQKEY